MKIELPDSTPVIEIQRFAERMGMIARRVDRDTIQMRKPDPAGENVRQLRPAISRHPTFDGGPEAA